MAAHAWEFTVNKADKHKTYALNWGHHLTKNCLQKLLLGRCVVPSIRQGIATRQTSDEYKGRVSNRCKGVILRATSE